MIAGLILLCDYHGTGSPEGCLIKQVFVLDLIKVFVLELNFLAKFNEDFIEVFVLDLN